LILAAFYGHGDKITEIFYKDKQKKFDFRDMELLIANEIASSSEYFNDNDIFSEILDLRTVLQYFVKSSSLEFQFENLKKIPGIFNPCIEENSNPFLYIK